jgi:CheY-like chemotaxis protein
MEAMGHLAGGIAHDFNNLLTAVNGYAELLVTELGDDPLAEDAREIRRAGERAAELTRQVLAFARRQVLTPKAIDVNQAVDGVSQMLGRLIGEHVLLVTTPSRGPAVVLADPGQLEQVLVNLAINARDAMPGGGTLEIRVDRFEEAGDLGRNITGPGVLLTVTDTGTGMDETTLAHAFEPFFTTKQAGTGLGLATVHGIVHQSNGEVWAESSPGHGTTVSVLLRRVDAATGPASEPALPSARTGGRGTVLVAEDEPAVRSFVVSTLERAGYRVLVAGSPAEAVALTDGLDEPIDLLLTDMVMPGSSGQALAERLTAGRPSLRVVLMSGYDPELAAHPMAGSFLFLAKPFGGDELTAAVARALSE